MALKDISQGLKIYKGLAEITTPDVDYDILMETADIREMEAKNLELQVNQQANLLRESFIKAVGTAKYSAARRGVKVGEGDTATNIEESSIAVGEDIQTAKDTAKFKAGQLKRSAKYLRSSAKRGSRRSGMLNLAKGLTTLSGAINKPNEKEAMKKASMDSGKAYAKYKKKKGVV